MQQVSDGPETKLGGIENWQVCNHPRKRAWVLPGYQRARPGKICCIGRGTKGGKIMKLVNLTPHPVTFVADDGEKMLELPGNPNPPRAQESRNAHGEVNGIPVNKVAMGEVQGLPDPQPGIGYIVSRIVAEAARRSDLYIPDQTVRDEQGRIIGCKALAQV